MILPVDESGGTMTKAKLSSSFWPYPALLVLACLFACSTLIPQRGLAGPGTTEPAAPEDTKDKPYVIEYYYKTKWGHADEFISLFKKNHYPVLKKEIEMGRILKVFADAPRYHSTEDGRWDYRTTIIFKNAAIANADADNSALLKQLFPDQDAYKREEQRRFEILEAHWDVPIKSVDLDK
jgi:hypothetical protein